MTEPPTPPPFVPYVPGSAPQAATPAPPPASAPAGTPSAPRRGRPLLFTAVGLVAGLVIGAGAASAVTGGGEEPALAAASPAPGTVYVTVTVAAPAPAASSPEVVVTTSPPPPPPPAAPTIDDGTWTVGEDVPVGTYKTTGAPDSCYWAIYKSGQNQDAGALLTNHSGAGNLRVTLKAGQDFETNRCGSWTKIG